MTARLPETIAPQYFSVEATPPPPADCLPRPRSRSQGVRKAIGNPEVEIELCRPFEEIVPRVLSLPWSDGDSEDVETDAELRTFLRGLYEAANGRQVETTIGFVSVAPPVAEFLKAKPYRASTQVGFLMEVAARILCGPDCYANEEPTRSNNHE